MPTPNDMPRHRSNLRPDRPADHPSGAEPRHRADDAGMSDALRALAELSGAASPN